MKVSGFPISDYRTSKKMKLSIIILSYAIDEKVYWIKGMYGNIRMN